jgi:hypothetical protein
MYATEGSEAKAGLILSLPRLSVSPVPDKRNRSAEPGPKGSSSSSGRPSSPDLGSIFSGFFTSPESSDGVFHDGSAESSSPHDTGTGSNNESGDAEERVGGSSHGPTPSSSSTFDPGSSPMVRRQLISYKNKINSTKEEPYWSLSSNLFEFAIYLSLWTYWAYRKGLLSKQALDAGNNYAVKY